MKSSIADPKRFEHVHSKSAGKRVEISMSDLTELLFKNEQSENDIIQACQALDYMNENTKRFKQEMKVLTSMENYLRIGVTNGEVPEAQKRCLKDTLATTVRNELANQQWWTSVPDDFRHPVQTYYLYEKLGETMNKLLNENNPAADDDDENESGYTSSNSSVCDSPVFEKLLTSSPVPEKHSASSPEETNASGNRLNSPMQKKLSKLIDCFSNDLILSPRVLSPTPSVCSSASESEKTFRLKRAKLAMTGASTKKPERKRELSQLKDGITDGPQSKFSHVFPTKGSVSEENTNIGTSSLTGARQKLRRPMTVAGSTADSGLLRSRTKNQPNGISPAFPLPRQVTSGVASKSKAARISSGSKSARK